MTCAGVLAAVAVGGPKRLKTPPQKKVTPAELGCMQPLPRASSPFSLTSSTLFSFPSCVERQDKRGQGQSHWRQQDDEQQHFVSAPCSLLLPRLQPPPFCIWPSKRNTRCCGQIESWSQMLVLMALVFAAAMVAAFLVVVQQELRNNWEPALRAVGRRKQCQIPILLEQRASSKLKYRPYPTSMERQWITT